MQQDSRPYVSVVVKCLNEEKNVERCIRALLAQTAAHDAEIILADCISSDRTVEIARRFPIRIVQLADPATRRCGAAAQLGWQYARGQYLLLIDADMELCRGFLEAGLAALRDDPSLAGVGGTLIEMSSGTEFRERVLRANPDERPGLVNRLSGCVLYRGFAAGEDGYFMDRNLHCMEEFEAGLRMRRRGWRLRVLPVATVRHYGHTDGSFGLLARRWRTRGFDGYGELIRACWERVAEPGVVSACAKACRFQVFTLAWWVALACLAAATAASPWLGGPVLVGAALGPLGALALRKGDLGRAFHSWCIWQVSAAALVRGLLAQRVPPTRPLASVVLQGAAAPRAASGGQTPRDFGSPSGTHVCLLCPGSAGRAGGIGRFVANLTAEIRRTDPAVEVEIVDTRGGGHISLAPFFYARALARISWLTLSGRSPILHVNVSSRGSALRKYFVVLLASALCLPVVLHLHGAMFDSFYAGLPTALQRRVRAMFARAERVVVLGAIWRSFAVQTLGVLEARISVVPNGVPRPAIGAPAAPDGAVPHVVFLGRLGARKGLPELIAAFGSAEVRRLRWRATIAGDADSGPFETEAARLGIADRLRFPGWLDEGASAELLRSATLLVLPSRAEGLPMAVVEALAHSVPVIATSVGAIPDFLTDGDSALLVPPGEPAQLAQALARLIGSPDLRERLGRRGHDVFARNFDIAEIAERFTALYAGLAASRAARGAPAAAHPS